MTETLGTRFEPASIEPGIYKSWEEGGFFRPDEKSKAQSFTIMIPPPNVTGALHMGHGLNNTIQDVVIRFQRMQGKKALWMPGTDHAGIATQNVVEKELKKQGKNRHQLGREAFLKEVWNWKEVYEKRILSQLRRLGSSCDWSRTRFTMDEGLSRAVRTAFVKWFDRGLIYRGKYIVNWCTRCQTALSDEESEHKETKGHLWRIRYPMKDGAGASIEVATTRPETMLGDVAVAVNPEDTRYKKFVGKKLVLPLVGRELSIVADNMVDAKFGTGAVKVTPAHDPNDFGLGQRHKLEQINIMTPDGKINENAPEKYRGLDRFEARKQIVADLEAQGLLAGVEDHQHAVGRCYRCDTVVEPYLSEQWFVKMKPFAEKAIEAQKKGLIKFHPARWENFYLSWLENIHDWCISRQLWWGHQIPVWHCESCGERKAYLEDPKQCAKCKSSKLTQDPDVLDTWFSSQLWPFSTLGWPDDTQDLKTFYPTNLLSTDRGIIFFWVARMVMAGLDLTGKIPFSDVYIHGTILDAQGRKMSKSLGNGIDPLELIEQYGADATRYSLMILTKEGQDVKLAKDKILQGRNFCNKIWNASRFVLMNLEGTPKADPNQAIRLEDRWIRSRLYETISKVTEALEGYRLNDAAQTLYSFIWNDFCDWYLEAVKPRLSQPGPDREMARAILVQVLDSSLRLLHPFTPYISEEIWGKLKAFRNSKDDAALLIVASWPKNQEAGSPDSDAENLMSGIQDAVRAIRNIRAVNVLDGATQLQVQISVENESKFSSAEIQHNVKLIAHWAGIEDLTIGKKLPRPKSSVLDVWHGGLVYVPLPEGTDIGAQKQMLQKKMEKVQSGIKTVQAKFANKAFVKNADPEIVESEKKRLTDMERELQLLADNLKGL